MNIGKFNPNNIKIDEKSCKNILIYHIGYVTIKEYVKFYKVNPLYLISRYINGQFEEINGSKYLTLVPTDESKEKIKKYEELWIRIKDLLRSVTKNSDDNDYDEIYMKIKFHSDEELPVNKAVELFFLKIINENNKYYPQVFLDECLYKK